MATLFKCENKFAVILQLRAFFHWRVGWQIGFWIQSRSLNVN